MVSLAYPDTERAEVHFADHPLRHVLNRQEQNQPEGNSNIENGYPQQYNIGACGERSPVV